MSLNTPRKIRAPTIPVGVWFHELKEIDAVINEKISRSLEKGLGPAVRKAIFWNLDRDFGINDKNIAENPDRFVMGLEKIFGPVGGEFVVRLISKELIEEFKLPKSQDKEKTISDILCEVRQRASAQN